jgi:hypothetical protein
LGASVLRINDLSAASKSLSVGLSAERGNPDRDGDLDRARALLRTARWRCGGASAGDNAASVLVVVMPETDLAVATMVWGR